MNNIELIQEWYKVQCNGDWEHEYGVRIETLDNPGWSIKIDLVDTALEGFMYKYSVKTEEDWMELNSDGEVFIGYGDPLKFEMILDKFINDFALPNIKNSEIIYTAYEEINLPIGIKVYKPINIVPVSLTDFRIVSIPNYDFRDLKVVDVKDFEKINFEGFDIQQTQYKIDDIVHCKLKSLYDAPYLIPFKD